jgi:hypothetical protein
MEDSKFKMQDVIAKTPYAGISPEVVENIKESTLNLDIQAQKRRTERRKENGSGCGAARRKTKYSRFKM